MRDGSVWLHVLSSLSEIFDKLSVIFVKLSMHVTGVDEAEKDWRLFDIWDWRFDKLPVISAKLSLRVMGADEAETVDTLRYLELVVCEQAQLLRKLAPLRSPNGFFDF